MTRRTTNNYIDNKKMLQAFIDYRTKIIEAREKNLPEPRLPDYIGECFYLLAERIASRGNFASYTYIEEMKEDGIESCIIGANNFDPTKTNNPFGYFSKAIWMAFLRRIEKEHKENYIKFKLKQIMMISTDENLSVNGGSDDLKIMDTIISNFEEKKRKKKEDNNNIENKKNGTRYVKKRKIIHNDIEDNESDLKPKKQNTDINLIAEYIAKGGKINYVPTGTRSTDLAEDELDDNVIEEKDIIDTDSIDDGYGEETDDD